MQDAFAAQMPGLTSALCCGYVPKAGFVWHAGLLGKTETEAETEAEIEAVTEA